MEVIETENSEQEPFNLTDVDKWVLSQTDEEFVLHDWEDLKRIIGEFFECLLFSRYIAVICSYDVFPLSLVTVSVLTPRRIWFHSSVEYLRREHEETRLNFKILNHVPLLSTSIYCTYISQQPMPSKPSSASPPTFDVTSPGQPPQSPNTAA